MADKEQKQRMKTYQTPNVTENAIYVENDKDVDKLLKYLFPRELGREERSKLERKVRARSSTFIKIEDTESSMQADNQYESWKKWHRGSAQTQSAENQKKDAKKVKHGKNAVKIKLRDKLQATHEPKKADGLKACPAKPRKKLKYKRYDRYRQISKKTRYKMKKRWKKYSRRIKQMKENQTLQPQPRKKSYKPQSQPRNSFLEQIASSFHVFVTLAILLLASSLYT